jgi:tripartite-type tricarboxylate transporter receptor subunit TctC
MPQRKRAGVPAIAALMAVLAVPAAAESVEDFYKGKTITITMGTGPGGSFDLYGRTIAEHMPRHIPGKPNMIVEYMPGAGGVVAGNHIFGPAPQDGTKMLLSHAIPLVEKLEPSQGVRFQSAKFQWLGAYDAIVLTMTLWHTVPVKTIEDLKTADITIGSFSKTHLTHQWPVLLKAAIGAKYKVISGYKGGSDCNLAMERGEIHGWAPSYANLLGTKPDWVRDRKIKTLVQFSYERTPQLPDVPTLLEITPGPMKDVVEFITAGTPFSRAIALGPGVPADRVAALRKAFDALMQDNAFLADAEKRKLSIEPYDAAKVQALVTRLVSASPELVARVKQAIGQVN